MSAEGGSRDLTGGHGAPGDAAPRPPSRGLPLPEGRDGSDRGTGPGAGEATARGPGRRREADASGLRDPALAARCAALTEGEADEVALMATLACELHHADARCDWTGFYRVVAPGLLKIGPYQGGHGCLAIPFDRGVCGACARTGEPQIVADVHAFADHIACSATTRSEIVLPVRRGGALIGILDIDSDLPDAFAPADADALAAILAAAFDP